jgi:hypothetical protein
MEMKKLLMTATMIAMSVGMMNAQTVQRQVVEDGGIYTHFARTPFVLIVKY